MATKKGENKAAKKGKAEGRLRSTKQAEPERAFWFQEGRFNFALTPIDLETKTTDAKEVKIVLSVDQWPGGADPEMTEAELLDFARWLAVEWLKIKVK